MIDNTKISGLLLDAMKKDENITIEIDLSKKVEENGINNISQQKAGSESSINPPIAQAGAQEPKSEIAYLAPEKMNKAVEKREDRKRNQDENRNNGLSLFEAQTRQLRAFNQAYEERKKFKKNQQEQFTEANIARICNELAFTTISPFLDRPNSECGFDWDKLPGDLKGVVEAFSTVTGWDQFPMLLGVLGATAMSLRGRHWIKPDEYWPAELMTLYQVFVTSSGDRKSQVVELFKEPFKMFLENWELEKAPDAMRAKQKDEVIQLGKKRMRNKEISRIVNSSLPPEEILGQLEQEAEEIGINTYHEVDPKSLRPYIFADKGTAKGLAKILQNNGECLAFFEAEDGLFKDLLVNNNYNPNLILKGYTGEEFAMASMNYDLRIKHPCFNILYIAQNDVTSKMYKNPILAEVGVTPRIMPFFAKKPSLTGICSDPSVRERIGIYNDKIFRLIKDNYTTKISDAYFVYTLTSDAYARIKQFESECHEQILKTDGGVVAFLKKLHGTAVRIAGLIHVWNHYGTSNYQINLAEIEMAINILYPIYTHASYAFSPKGLLGRGDAIKILKWVCKHKKNRFNSRNIAQFVRDAAGNKMDNGKIFPALELLEGRNYLRQHIEPDKARECVMHPRFDYNSFVGK